MQTERVTFLTTPDHKAALDAYARESGKSVGHVVREATSRYIAAPADPDDEEEALSLLVPEVDAAVTDMLQTIQTMRADIERACEVVDRVLMDDRR